MKINEAIQSIEWHQLDLDYKNIRIRTEQNLERMALSMRRAGQLLPIVVSKKPSGKWVVIDGYLRVQAWQSLGHDTINAQHCEQKAISALTYYFLQHQTRPFQAIEEASLLQILLSAEDISQTEIAKRFGKSKSWVCQRVKLLTELPEYLQHVIYDGAISTWAAQRIFIPFARANSNHAKQLIQYVRHRPRSTRELQGFYEHYMQSNRKIRTGMINEPELYFNASAHQATKKNTPVNSVPEDRWCSELLHICKRLKQVEVDAKHVFYLNQPQADRQKLLAPLQSIQSCLESIYHTIRSYHDDRS